MDKEYIDREKALEITKRTSGDYATAFSKIRQLPAADVAPVVHGEWVFGKLGLLGCSVQCSECGWGAENVNKMAWLEYNGHKYCGNCSAKMEVGGHGD